MKTMFMAVGSYFLIVNLWGFILMFIDKRRAERSHWRISEFSLFIPAILGGALGCLLGMRLFHHKTKHLKFVIGMPFLLIVYVAAIVFLLFFSPYNFSFM